MIINEYLKINKLFYFPKNRDDLGCKILNYFLFGLFGYNQHTVPDGDIESASVGIVTWTCLNSVRQSGFGFSFLLLLFVK